MSGGGLETANRALVMAAYAEVLQPFDASRVDEFFAPDYIQHSPLAEDGAAGLKAFLNWARETSPNARHHIRRVFADGDFVIIHLQVVLEPGDPGLAVVDIFRVQDGRIAEHWDVMQPAPEAAPNPNGMF
ncbi:MAG TPA: nuclear transport factor 2 family protein [Caulobacteraceae bacterium]